MPGRDVLRAAVIGDQMTEDELLAGITEALELGGWVWTHIRRSDGVTMGWSGLPDVIAAHDDLELVLAWELKSRSGRVSPDQLRWLFALGTAAPNVDARIIRPADYDQALEVLIRHTSPAAAFDR
jgi:hypothetical protein